MPLKVHFRHRTRENRHYKFQQYKWFQVCTPVHDTWCKIKIKQRFWKVKKVWTSREAISRLSCNMYDERYTRLSKAKKGGGSLRAARNLWKKWCCHPFDKPFWCALSTGNKMQIPLLKTLEVLINRGVGLCWQPENSAALLQNCKQATNAVTVYHLFRN